MGRWRDGADLVCTCRVVMCVPFGASILQRTAHVHCAPVRHPYSSSPVRSLLSLTPQSNALTTQVPPPFLLPSPLPRPVPAHAPVSTPVGAERPGTCGAARAKPG